MRIGVDVGGTNTDAVLMDGARVVSSTKTPTTANVSEGIAKALRSVIEDSGIDRAMIDGVMIGTTHFTNAVVERKHLTPTACIRLGLPATVCLPPMVDWPDDLREMVGGNAHLAHGGHEFDGREISEFQPDEVRSIAEKIRDAGLDAIAISSVFSPVNATFEEQSAEIVRSVIPGANITLSSEIGRIGLLERENAAIMNSCLRQLAARTVDGFKAALDELRITAPFYISQNDGTLMNADFAKAYPVLTFASGPTNSMRGAAFLSGLRDAIVVDVGGTTTDIGVLQHGFPRVAALAVDIGGVRTNFRMPDLISIGLGGGTVVRDGRSGNGSELAIGPDSVGYAVATEALCVGGSTLTLSDISLASGRLDDFGDRKLVDHLEPGLVRDALSWVDEQVSVMSDRMKSSRAEIPLLAVGGGAHLVAERVSGISEVLRPRNYSVANAYGACIAEASGTVDRVYSYDRSSREECLDDAKELAGNAAVRSGAHPDRIRITTVTEVPMTYVPGGGCRVMVKAVGPLA